MEIDPEDLDEEFEGDGEGSEEPAEENPSPAPFYPLGEGSIPDRPA